MLKKILFITVLCLSVSSVFAVELIPTQELLAGYLQKDSDMKNLALELKKAEISRESSQLDKGLNIKLATGNMTFNLGDENSFSVKPSVTASLPSTSNLSMDVSGDFSSQNGEFKFKGASANVSLDLISSNKINNEVQKLQSDRKVLEAQRNINSKAIDKEKSFYKSLSSLLSSISNLVSKQLSFTDDINSFEKTKLEGYSESSSSYIRAEMKYLTSERDLQTAVHNLIKDYKLFYLDCGYDIKIPEDIDFLLLVPDDISAVAPLDVTAFDRNQYTQIESTLWNDKINELSRSVNKNLSLTANGGYSYTDSSVNAGVNGSYNGLSVSARVDVPIQNENQQQGKGKKSPTVTVGVTYSPNTFKKNKLSDETTAITIEQEEMKHDSVYDAYETAVQERIIKLSDLEWTKTTNQKNLEMYEEIEKSMNEYYKKGLISDKDYLSAKNNVSQTKIKQLINNIDFILYNDDVKTMFVE